MQDKPNKTILLVDDDQEILDILSYFFKPTPYKIISTTKGKEAVNLAKEQKPDLIILDIVMPDMDGGEVAEVLSEDPTTADIPIVFLTGILTKAEETLGKGKSGKRHVVAKPVTQKQLLEMVQKVFSGQLPPCE